MTSAGPAAVAASAVRTACANDGSSGRAVGRAGGETGFGGVSSRGPVGVT